MEGEKWSGLFRVCYQSHKKTFNFAIERWAAVDEFLCRLCSKKKFGESPMPEKVKRIHQLRFFDLENPLPKILLLNLNKKQQIKKRASCFWGKNQRKLRYKCFTLKRRKYRSDYLIHYVFSRQKTNTACWVKKLFEKFLSFFLGKTGEFLFYLCR